MARSVSQMLGRGVSMAQKDDVWRNLVMGPPLFVNRNVIGPIEIYKALGTYIQIESVMCTISCDTCEPITSTLPRYATAKGSGAIPRWDTTLCLRGKLGDRRHNNAETITFIVQCFKAFHFSTFFALWLHTRGSIHVHSLHTAQNDGKYPIDVPLKRKATPPFPTEASYASSSNTNQSK